MNFAQIKNEEIVIRTYERGVEAETLACGTGATATAIAAFYSGLIYKSTINLIALGGDLQVSFTKTDNVFTNVKLVGGAEFVFKGNIYV